jgi:circadian clock protein KaiB
MSQHREPKEASCPLPKKYQFRLFVTGATAKSSKAISNLTQVCERYLADDYDLDVVDIYQQPELARGQEIIAAPTLIKYFPLPLQRFIGDLSSTRELLKALDVQGK